MTKTEIYYAKNDGMHILKLVGDIRLLNSKPLDDFNKQFLNNSTDVHDLTIDLNETTGIDSTGLGLLAQIAILFNEQTGGKPALVCVSKSIERVLHAVNFEELFTIINKTEIPPMPLKNLESGSESESETDIAKRALNAHRILASLSDANKKEFKSVVEFLEKELKKK